MATARRPFTEEEIEAAWQRAIIQSNNDPNVYRKDYAGAWIRRQDYGQQTEYGWEIDHVRPLALDGTYNPRNLMPLHWQNNLEKSDDFPLWNTKITSNGIHNVEEQKSWYVNPANYA